MALALRRGLAPRFGASVLLGALSLAAGCGEGEPPPTTFDPERGYEPREVAPGATTPEVSAPTAMPPTGASVTLEDGTELAWPAVETVAGTEPVTTVTLSRETTTADLSGTELTSSGSTRVLTFEPFDPHARGALAADFSPTIRFPAAELGDLAPDTVVVVRVVDRYDEDGVERQGVVEVLPAHVEEDGTVIARDYLFPDSVTDAARSQAEGGRGGPGGVVTPNHIAYVIGTFQGSANWSRSPTLVQMAPSSSAPGLRAPGTSSPGFTVEHPDLPRCESSITPVLVLVHGHNEEEGAGFGVARSAPPPWSYAYKRDVWARVYGQMLEAGDDAFQCARIYELVYPSYRPIFSQTGMGRERLDEAFARLLRTELMPLVQGGREIQITIVAHSMGGLVVRSGLQLLPQALTDRVRHVLTWGTPHLGSPLVSLRYVLASPVPYELDHAQMNARASTVLGALGSSSLVNEQAWRLARSAISSVQIDSPGTRDLRWARNLSRPPHALALDDLFNTTAAHAADPPRFDLGNGTELYSDNTRLLVENDAVLAGGTYAYLFGTTSKRIVVSAAGGPWYTPQVIAGEIAIGATTLEWLVSDPNGGTSTHRWGESDGAVPFASMTSAGQSGTMVHVGDVDHEEYFGPAPPMGSDLGLATARETLARIDMRDGAACPAIVARVVSNDGRWARVEGSVSFPGLADLPAANVAGGAGVQLVANEDWSRAMLLIADDTDPTATPTRLSADGTFTGFFHHIFRQQDTTSRLFNARFQPPGGRACIVIGAPEPYPPIPEFEDTLTIPDRPVQDEDPVVSLVTDWARASYEILFFAESTDVRVLPRTACGTSASCEENIRLVPDEPMRVVVAPTVTIAPAEGRLDLSGTRYTLYRIESLAVGSPEIFVTGGLSLAPTVEGSRFTVEAMGPLGGTGRFTVRMQAVHVAEEHDGDTVLGTTRTPFTFLGPYFAFSVAD